MEEEIHWRVYVDLLSNTDLTTEVGFGVKAHLEHVHICTCMYMIKMHYARIYIRAYMYICNISFMQNDTLISIFTMPIVTLEHLFLST